MMTDSGELYTGIDVNDNLSNAMGTETFAHRVLVPPGFDNNHRARTEGLQIETFQHRRFLKVDLANTRESFGGAKKLLDAGDKYPGR
jgi:hypothetical protein